MIGPDLPTPRRVSPSYVEQLEERMSPRDRAVVETINLVRVATGLQLERLCFAMLPPGRSRTVVRSRVLARLVAARVLIAVGRRVGGDGRGSTKAAYALDTAGQRLVKRWQLAAGSLIRVRRAIAPGERSLQHLIAISELYAGLTEAIRPDDGEAIRFRTEPACWWPNATGGQLKPDAYATLQRPGAVDHWWFEIDMATESLPTLRAKLAAYLDFARRDGHGPASVMPWVLVVTSTAARRDAVQRLLRSLPEAADVVRTIHALDAASFVLQLLRE